MRSSLAVEYDRRGEKLILEWGISQTLTEKQMKLSLILIGFDLGRKYQVCLERNPAHHISRGKDLDR